MLTDPPSSGDLVYVARRGQEYEWRREAFGVLQPVEGPDPDVWVYYAGDWPAADPDRFRAIFDDLLEEMESMAGGIDRCRWPLDEPWPAEHRH